MDDIRSLTEITQKVQNEAMKFWQHMVDLNSSSSCEYVYFQICLPKMAPLQLLTLL
jgi:hypothetical protein